MICESIGMCESSGIFNINPRVNAVERRSGR